MSAQTMSIAGRRAVPEWIGATPDSMPPPAVRLRIFERHGGRCYLSKRKIMPGDAWDLDHVLALCNGGENRETNLAPVLRDKHREKTAQDVKQKAKADRIRKKHLGLRKRTGLSKHPTLKRGLDGKVRRRDGIESTEA